MVRLRALPLVVLLVIAGCARNTPNLADARAQTIEQRKDALIGQLADCESGGKGDGARNGSYVGRLQFEPRTVIAYVRERDGRTISAQEAIALASDYSQASSLAKYMIFERGGASHWPACGRKLGLAQQVAEIKSL
jgi:hypothetical protein